MACTYCVNSYIQFFSALNKDRQIRKQRKRLLMLSTWTVVRPLIEFPAASFWRN